MRQVDIEKCRTIVNEYNDILCKHIKELSIVLEGNVENFEVYISHPTLGTQFICFAEPIESNPALVYVDVPNEIKSELWLDDESSIICDSTFLHLVLDKILCTRWVVSKMFEYIWDGDLGATGRY